LSFRKSFLVNRYSVDLIADAPFLKKKKGKRKEKKERKEERKKFFENIHKVHKVILTLIPCQYHAKWLTHRAHDTRK